MKKSIILLLRIAFANKLTQNITTGPQVGFTKGENITRVQDAALHCQLSALETCTTSITAQLCMVKIYFGNCPPVAAHGENCDSGKEG